ncbi:MAG: metallophosphoesterase family protein [Bacilli bacterium]|nr:metallophosphoesterase family protein [Bacilli bacterium]
MATKKVKNIEEESEELVEITEENIKSYADELQFETLAHECIVEDLAKSYNMSREDIFILIHELRRRGNNVVTLNTTANAEMDPSLPERNEQVTLVRNFGHQKLVDDMNYTIIDNDEEVKIMMISDTRFGSVYEQITHLNNLFLKAKKLGCKYVFLTGDVVEGIYTGAKSIYNSTLHKNGVVDQAEYVGQMFPRVEGITTLFITGEHDLSFLKTKEKIDIGTLIDAKREDMIYLGPKRRKITIKKDDPRSGEVSIYLQHSQGTVPYTVSYKPQQKIASLRNEEKTDILVTSHYAACDSFERRGVRSFQVPTMVATTDEMKDARTPVYNTVGGWIVTLKRDPKGKLINTSQLWIPYYDTIEDDYRTAKALYLSDNKQVFIQRPIERNVKDRIYSSIRNGEELSSVLEKLGVSELQFGGLLEEFIARGYDIKTEEKDGKIVITKKRKTAPKQKMKPDMDELTVVRETWISDTHLCNEAQQLHMINKIYEETARRGITTVRHFGDISDGDYQNRPEHRYELFRLGLARQLKYLVKYYPKVDGVTTILIDGNHDLTHNKNGGAILGELLAQYRDDIIWAGSEFAMVHPKDINGNEVKTDIEMLHPGGGCASSLSYRSQKLIDKMEPGTKPNVLGQGHFHQSHFLSYRNVIALLLPCLTAKSDFSIRQGLENTMGAYFITMYTNSQGEIEMFEFEEKRFAQKDVKEDDWEKTRPLVLKKVLKPNNARAS